LLRALEEHNVMVDVVLAESKAVAVAASWALGYSSAQTEKMFQENPVRELASPFPLHYRTEERFTPYGPDPMQVEIPLDVDEKKSPSHSLTREPGEYLHLSWWTARLTHGASGGPVADLQATPRRMAVQVADLVSGQALTVTDGELQNVIKGALLPKEVVKERPRLRHYASGSLLSGHAMLANQPFTFDRVLRISAGPRLRPPTLELEGGDWNDSLSRRILAAAAEQNDAAASGKIVRIELTPENWFDGQVASPHEWIELGYRSALKSMDLIFSAFGADSAARPGPAARAHLDLASGNHVVSEGNVLLLNLLDEACTERPDSSGKEPVAALMRSGYYSDLDLEWVPGIGSDAPSLVFDAKEKTKLLLRAGANAGFTQEEIVDRPPEIGAQLVWSEPFYVPFRGDIAAIVGGHQPGARIRAVIAPVVPFPMELGLSRAHWELDFREAPASLSSLDAWRLRLRRDLTRLSLRLSPRPDMYFITAGERHELAAPPGAYGADPTDFLVDEHNPSDFLSNDFEQQGFIGLGGVGPSGVHRQSLWMQGRYLNRVNVFGEVKDPFSSVESRLRLSAGDFRLLHQFYWSDQGLRHFPSGPDSVYDAFQMGRISALSFQDEFFSMRLRGPFFQNAHLEYAPMFGKIGLRLLAGAFQFFGPKVFPERSDRPVRGYWEVQGAYATPVGPLRGGIGGLEGERPAVFLRFGADLSLAEGAPEP
jgi:hypothetical protein